MVHILSDTKHIFQYKPKKYDGNILFCLISSIQDKNDNNDDQADEFSRDKCYLDSAIDLPYMNSMNS